MTPLSLRSRLALIILVPLIVISIVAGYWRFTVARQTAEELFDRTLLASSLAIARDIAVSGGDALSETTRDLMRDTSGGQIFYHVHGPDGVFITGYATPPVAPAGVAQVEGIPIFFEAVYRGEDVRVVRLREAGEVDGITGISTVTIWQTFGARNQFVRELAVRAILLMASLIATVAAVVWLGINFGLRPLTDLQRAISRRSSDELGEIKRPMPPEVRGIVSTLNKLFGQLEMSIKARDVFISDAAHQLRNPIAGVLSMAEAVRSAPTSDDAAERTTELVDAARHASRLANQMLSYERARASAESRQRHAFDLVDVVRDVVARNTSKVAACGVELETKFEYQALTLHGEEMLLAEAIENLLDNALKHAGPDLSHIRVETGRDPGQIWLSVCDDGRGIDAADRVQAFERFRQLAPGQGSGLGLSIVETVAQSHGGSVVIEDVEKGTRITMRFPDTAA